MKATKGVSLLAFALVMLLGGAALGGAHISMVMHHVGVEIGWFAASAASFVALLIGAISKAVAK